MTPSAGAASSPSRPPSPLPPRAPSPASPRGRARIAACMVCGSRELRWPNAADGVAVGQAQNLDLRVCEHGHVGVPLLFDDEADWRAFAADLQAGADRGDAGADAGGPGTA